MGGVEDHDVLVRVGVAVEQERLATALGVELVLELDARAVAERRSRHAATLLLPDRRGEREVLPPVRQPAFMATYLVSRYSSMPSRPPSRPTPECLTPPNGAEALDTMPWLRPTMPVSSASMTRNARVRSDV